MDTHTTAALRTGRLIPVLGLGTWELTRDTAGPVLHALNERWSALGPEVQYL